MGQLVDQVASLQNNLDLDRLKIEKLVSQVNEHEGVLKTHILKDLEKRVNNLEIDVTKNSTKDESTSQAVDEIKERIEALRKDLENAKIALARLVTGRPSSQFENDAAERDDKGNF
jgi:chromosome segregation ATPase